MPKKVAPTSVAISTSVVRTICVAMRFIEKVPGKDAFQGSSSLPFDAMSSPKEGTLASGGLEPSLKVRSEVR